MYSVGPTCIKQSVGLFWLFVFPILD